MVTFFFLTLHDTSFLNDRRICIEIAAGLLTCCECRGLVKLYFKETSSQISLFLVAFIGPLHQVKKNKESMY